MPSRSRPAPSTMAFETEPEEDDAEPAAEDDRPRGPASPKVRRGPNQGIGPTERVPAGDAEEADELEEERGRVVPVGGRGRGSTTQGRTRAPRPARAASARRPPRRRAGTGGRRADRGDRTRGRRGRPDPTSKPSRPRPTTSPNPSGTRSTSSRSAGPQPTEEVAIAQLLGRGGRRADEAGRTAHGPVGSARRVSAGRAGRNRPRSRSAPNPNAGARPGRPDGVHHRPGPRGSGGRRDLDRAGGVRDLRGHRGAVRAGGVLPRDAEAALPTGDGARARLRWRSSSAPGTTAARTRCSRSWRCRCSRPSSGT